MIPFTTRSEWGAEHGRGSQLPGPKPLVVIHHSFRPALKADTPPEEERAAVRGIEHFHVESNGWSGIGYNWLVAPSGRVYEGRGWGRKGAHAGPVNSTSVGVCLLINGEVQKPTTEMVTSVQGLIRAGVAAGEIDEDYEITGHRDHMPRECPGDLVYGMLDQFEPRESPQFPVPDVELVGAQGSVLFHELPDRVEPLLKERALDVVGHYAGHDESWRDFLCRSIAGLLDGLPWYAQGIVRSALGRVLGCSLTTAR